MKLSALAWVLLLSFSPVFGATATGGPTDACGNPDYGWSGCRLPRFGDDCCAADNTHCLPGWEPYYAGYNTLNACGLNTATPLGPPVNQCNTYPPSTGPGVFDSLCAPRCGDGVCLPEESCFDAGSGTGCSDCGACSGPGGGSGGYATVDLSNALGGAPGSYTFNGEVDYYLPCDYADKDANIYVISPSGVQLDGPPHSFTGDIATVAPEPYSATFNLDSEGTWRVCMTAAMDHNCEDYAATECRNIAIACPAGQNWDGTACVASTCGAATVGDACATLSGTSAGYYCSDGQNTVDGNPNNGNCCPVGEYWDSGLGLCRNTLECRPSFCNALEGTAAFFSNPQCVGGGQACCSVGLKYGINPYYDYTDASGSTTPGFRIY